MDGKTRLIPIAIVVVLFVAALGEISYVNSQKLHSPGTVQLAAVIMGTDGKKLDPLNCLLAGQQTGWTGYWGYVGFIQADEQKLDVIAEDGKLTAGDYALNDCDVLTEIITDGKTYRQLFVLKRFGQIWYKIEGY